jgi:hypothetical protein
MSCYCIMKVSLRINAPLLCSATGASRWGLDATFRRNYEGNPSIPKSHVKGKLREAWEELKAAGALSVDIEKWLGKPASGFVPEKGQMRLSDFDLNPPEHRSGLTTHRIQIEKTSGTADEGAFFNAEALFLSGQIMDWQGELSYPASTREEAEALRDHILVGLRWICAYGSQKTVGFGRAVEVQLISFERHDSRFSAPTPGVASQVIGLSIQAREPLMVGGVRIRDNYLASETVIPGGVVKGAIAQCLRDRVGLSLNQPIGPCQEMTDAGLDLLAAHFDAIRFTHAFPSRHPDQRPVKPPLTLVKAGGLHDVALAQGPVPINDRAPEYVIDWKDSSDVEKAFGWAWPERFSETRTAIEKCSRKADEEKLYTFDYACPTFKEGNGSKEVHWLGHIYLPQDLGQADIAALSSQLQCVVHDWFRHIGKRDGRIQPALSGGPWLPCKGSVAQEPDGLVIVTLQSDALMLNPWVIGSGSPQGLFDLYREYWREVSHGGCDLVRYFASQRTAGGYLGMRFRAGGDYAPYLLTAAGSVFVLDLSKPEAAGQAITDWKNKGLPLPEWTIDRYGGGSGAVDWRRCPFTPEDGYGEVAINLECHQKQEDMSK